MKTKSSDGEVYCKSCAICIYTELALYAVCAGPCGNSFHISCIGMRREQLQALSQSIVWLCKECQTAFSGWKDSLQDSSSALNDTSTVNTEISLLKTQVATIMDTLERIIPRDSSSVTDDLPHSTPIATTNVTSGTNLSIEHQRSGPNEAPERTRDNCFSLLLTNIDTAVSEHEVESMVHRCLGVPIEDRINAKKLVPKRIDCRSLDYISFKIDLNWKWKDLAMCVSTWPSNIKFREFQRRPVTTWKP